MPCACWLNHSAKILFPHKISRSKKKHYTILVMDPSLLCQLEDALHSSQPILPQMIIPENDLPKTLHLIPKNNTLGNHKQMLESKLRFLSPLPLLLSGSLWFNRWPFGRWRRWRFGCCFGLQLIFECSLICSNPINAKKGGEGGRQKPLAKTL